MLLTFSYGMKLMWNDLAMNEPSTRSHDNAMLLSNFLICMIWGSGQKTEINNHENLLRWPRDTLYPQKLALLRQQSAVARST
jgi:hypothetical protein